MRYFLSIGILLVLWSYPAFAKEYKEEFVSPDKSCRILYEGASGHGNGAFYDMSNTKKKLVLKEYFRLGSMINWVSNSIAEIICSEGSPAYHSYYYDCQEHRISPSYFQNIAFEPKTKVVATIVQEEIVFYKLFSAKEFYRAPAPDVGLTEYFIYCESNTVFEGTNVLHIRMKCHEGDNVDLKIKVPN